METTPSPVRSPTTQLADHTRANDITKELPKFKLHNDIVALPSTLLVLKSQSISSRTTCLRDVIEYKNYKDKFCLANGSNVIPAPVASTAAVEEECKRIESGGTVPCLGRHIILQEPSTPPAYDPVAEKQYSDTANKREIRVGGWMAITKERRVEPQIASRNVNWAKGKRKETSSRSLTLPSSEESAELGFDSNMKMPRIQSSRARGIPRVQKSARVRRKVEENCI
ncbi:hypothetical protein BP6252_13181 [Coleophoma cylindrospora]|uniref:Uncharacterized protein n=1 Tax=Coleophoma cylindrospora TaxID=1849047 RepID=A0A3D8QA41_9HELO|nr:hypothetical protein BP6252_13181 [Coleophoma cylindrospora]